MTINFFFHDIEQRFLTFGGRRTPNDRFLKIAGPLTIFYYRIPFFTKYLMLS